MEVRGLVVTGLKTIQRGFEGAKIRIINVNLRISRERRVPHQQGQEKDRKDEQLTHSISVADLGVLQVGGGLSSPPTHHVFGDSYDRRCIARECGRVSPNILFVPLAPRDKYQQLKDTIYKFAKSSPSMGKKDFERR